MSYIIAFTGAHGTGKTTSAAEKFVELKKKHPDKSIKLLSDLEVMCPYPFGNGKCSLETQLWMLHNIALQELKYMSRFDIVVMDRTIIDPVVYTVAAGFTDIAEDMLNLAKAHLPFYQEIYFKDANKNEFCFDDGIRGIDNEYRLEIGYLLEEIYKKIEVKNFTII